MKTQALLGVVIGLWTLSVCVTHQYHFVYDQMNWTDAQQYCRDKFTDLATVHTLEDVNTLTRMVDSLNKAAWIGLYNKITSWRWSLADERFYNDAEEHKFRNWAPGKPNSHICAVMYANGKWKDDICTAQHYPICFNHTDPINKYIIVTKPLTWSEAQRECREKHTDLASVRNQAENQEIQKKIMNPGDHHWIGLYRHSWKWSDGSSSSFRDWKEGEPNGAGVRETCAAIEFASGSKLADRTCDKKAFFICYSVVVKKQVVKLAITSSLDMNDPAVADAILEQLKQNMKDHQGAPADIKVRWVEQADGRIFHKEDKKKREKKKWERKPRLTKREL